MSPFDDLHPYAKPFKDRHGKTRWRYRYGGKTKYLPGAPGDPDFEEAYRAAVEGREPRQAAVLNHPHAAKPQSLKAAWLLLKSQSGEWKLLDPQTKLQQTAYAEDFLRSAIVEGADEIWADVLVADIKRRHIKSILNERAERPFAAKHLLTVLRKMFLMALDEEWIEVDPASSVKWSPAYTGWRAWTDEERRKFEERWPVGTTPRLCYALALWLGNRRGDIVKMKPADLEPGGVRVVQQKGGKELLLPYTPMLREVLAATDLSGPAVLMTAYGKPFSLKSITGRMGDWTKSAGIGPGCTLHGLRKTLGKMLAEGGASTRQLMDTLGHDDIEHAELYSRAAEQKRLARDGMAKVVRMVQKGKKG